MKLTLKRDLPLLLAALLVIWGLWYARPVGVETLYPELPTAPADVLILPMTEDLSPAIALATQLRQAGIRTRQKIQVLDCPRVWADQASVSSKLSKAPRAVRYISGKATTMEAKMALYQFMTSFTPKCSRKKMPSGRLAPKRSSRK